MVSGRKRGKLVQKYYMRVEPADESDAPADVPEGCLAVYVGAERRRFVIQTELLYKRAFRELLRKSEEEYGFETAGGLRIACEAALFEKLLWQLETGGN